MVPSQDLTCLVSSAERECFALVCQSAAPRVALYRLAASSLGITKVCSSGQSFQGVTASARDPRLHHPCVLLGTWPPGGALLPNPPGGQGPWLRLVSLQPPLFVRPEPRHSWGAAAPAPSFPLMAWVEGSHLFFFFNSIICWISET